MLRNDLPALKCQTGHWGRENLLLGQFDLIIASDVLYERDQPETLSQFIHLHSANPVSIIVLDPDRGNRSAFSRQMAELGFGVDEVRLDRAASALLPAYKGRLLKYQR